jgi:tetratricopeptide (TPR) repeat protein
VILAAKVIAGCTALIQEGRESTANLVGAYSHRGSAYMRKAEYDRAIQDYGDAIRLNPNDASAYTDRGTPTSTRVNTTARSRISTKRFA